MTLDEYIDRNPTERLRRLRDGGYDARAAVVEHVAQEIVLSALLSDGLYLIDHGRPGSFPPWETRGAPDTRAFAALDRVHVLVARRDAWGPDGVTVMVHKIARMVFAGGPKTVIIVSVGDGSNIHFVVFDAERQEKRS